MKKITMFVCLSLVLAGAAYAGQSSHVANDADRAFVDARYGGHHSAGVVGFDKAQADTVYMMGHGIPGGQFEDGGDPDWNGWVPVDITAPESRWNVSDYNSPGGDGDNAWWCGQYFADDCDTGDNGGYGNAWFDALDFQGTAPNPAANTTVNVQAIMNFDTEIDPDSTWVWYDQLWLLFADASGGDFEGYAGWDSIDGGGGRFGGMGENVLVNLTWVMTSAQYTGVANDQIHLQWLFDSDGTYSDEDCLWPTMGACQIDNIAVRFNGVLQGTVEDCDDNPLQWFTSLDSTYCVGNFGQVWDRLTDIDPCAEDETPAVSWIDDGLVVPGSGPYLCTTWCYGPSGYVVNPEGGIADAPDAFLWDEIWSPVLQWPGNEYDGCDFRWDVYRHCPLDNFSTDPGHFYIWNVRSVGPGQQPQNIPGAEWRTDNYVYYGGPDWIRSRFDIADYLEQGRTYLQVSIGVLEYGWYWGYIGTDATPAPYIDNVSVAAFRFPGPAMSTRDIELANDNFPDIGIIDYTRLQNNWCRFDAAWNIAPPSHLRNDPGDSITFTIKAVRANTQLVSEPPKMYYKIFGNPLFDSIVRPLPLEGWVYGDSTFTSGGILVEGEYYFDLPDTGFLYPGDVLHYYIEAKDTGSGIATSLLPADTSGFSFGEEYPGYDSDFVVHFLPTLFSLTPGDQPQMLFWNDFGDRGGENEWYYALRNLGFRRNAQYDVYYTSGPSSGVGNGIGGRASPDQLRFYDTLLYTVGDLSTATITNGEAATEFDPSTDVLDSWFRLDGGNKNALFTGDDLVGDLTRSGSTDFLNNWFGVQLTDRDLRPLIGSQTAPTVRIVDGGGPLAECPEWIAYGGCPVINTFDAVETVGNATRLAEFLTPECVPGQYPYSAATLFTGTDTPCNVISLPYDLMYIYNGGCSGDPPAQAQSVQPSSTRTCILEQVLLSFGHVPGQSPETPTPDNVVGTFSVKNFPNPFNPITKIEYLMPKKGDLSIKIYNIRGELVKTLHDGPAEAGKHSIQWEGTNDSGAKVASGVYFYEAEAFGKVLINKMALVK